MKKIYLYLTMALVTMAFTSCSDDAQKAMLLDGTWTGYIETYYQDRWGITSDTYRTTLSFQQDSWYSGTGYEVDYDASNPYQDYYYCDFSWRVSNSVIYISYADSWNTVRIYDYTLDASYFRGYMDDGTTRDIWFDLRPVYDDVWKPYWLRSATRGEADIDHDENVTTGSSAIGRYVASGKFRALVPGKQ